MRATGAWLPRRRGPPGACCLPRAAASARARRRRALCCLSCRPRHFVGVVEIQELSDDDAPAGGTGGSPRDAAARRAAAALPAALQAAALYAADASAHDSSGGDDAAAQAAGADELGLGDLVAGATRAGLALSSPWSDDACQGAARHLLRGVARQQPGGGDEQQLLCAALPAVLAGLRDAVLAQHRYKQAQEGGADMGACRA